MRVTKAEAMGTCFGVNDAIDLALKHTDRDDLTILGQLVHNPQTVDKLKNSGIHLVDSLDSPMSTSQVMITAHGASDKVKQAVKDMGFKVEDATCPLVKRVHKVIKKMVTEGYYPIVIGQVDHVEVKGIVGDLENYQVIGSIEEIDKLRDFPRLGIVSQTTQKITTVEKIVEAIRKQGHEDVYFVDTVCKPTKDRQKAIEKLTEEVEAVVVVGGYNSSNTKKLKMVCENKGLPACHIESVRDLDAKWLNNFSHVGITAGTSTPKDVIDEVVNYIKKL